MDTLGEKFLELAVRPDRAEEARRLAPLSEREALGRNVFLFEDVDRQRLAALGEVRVPGVADLFVAKVRRASA